MDGITTEIIDKLFLELSQVTTAITAKELALTRALNELVECKNLKEQIESGEHGDLTTIELSILRAEYQGRKDDAWKTARVLLAAITNKQPGL